jgi:hypothetical protein
MGQADVSGVTFVSCCCEAWFPENRAALSSRSVRFAMPERVHMTFTDIDRALHGLGKAQRRTNS